MTNDELDQIEARARAATPGPWYADQFETEDGDGRYYAYQVFNADDREILGTENCHYLVAEIHDDRDGEGGSRWDEGARLNTAHIAGMDPQTTLALVALAGRAVVPTDPATVVSFVRDNVTVADTKCTEEHALKIIHGVLARVSADYRAGMLRGARIAKKASEEERRRFETATSEIIAERTHSAAYHLHSVSEVIRTEADAADQNLPPDLDAKGRCNLCGFSPGQCEKPDCPAQPAAQPQPKGGDAACPVEVKPNAAGAPNLGGTSQPDAAPEPDQLAEDMAAAFAQAIGDPVGWQSCIITLKRVLAAPPAPVPAGEVAKSFEGKPPVPAHDYALQWAKDTSTYRGEFEWGQYNLVKSYIALTAARLRAGAGEVTDAMLEAAQHALGEASRHIAQQDGLIDDEERYALGMILRAVLAARESQP